MDHINVQRWASSLRNNFQLSIVADVCVGSPNDVRTTSTIIKLRKNESINNNQFDKKRNLMSEDSDRISKPQLPAYNMLTKDDENLHSLSDNHHDIDAISDAGTYIIEDDETEQKTNSSSVVKRYGNKTKARHGTFDIHGLISSTAHTIHRPIVDSNISKQNLSCSSSNSSLLSFNEIEESLSSFIPQQISTSPKQNQIKPAESFVISPIFQTKSFPRKLEAQSSKPKLTTKSVPNKESSSTNQNSAEKYFSRIEKPSPPIKTSIRPHTTNNNQVSSSFQRQTSSLSTVDNDETISNLTKIYTNKSFVSRQQHSNITPSTSKSFSRQPLKSISSTSNNQTNRAVELRRARAQAKIEELAQRTKKRLSKPNQQLDIMSASWHSNANTTNKKDISNLRVTPKTKIVLKKEDLSVTRTISSSFLSISSHPIEIIDNQRMNTSTYCIEGERRDSLRDNGQRLAIKLIQLSSGILEKLKPNDVVSVRELEQLVDKLQTVNRTLSSIDAALTGSTTDDTLT